MTDDQNTSSSLLIATIFILILAAAGGVSAYLILNPATAEKKEHQGHKKVTVETMPVTLATHPIEIELMGRVTPAKETELKARVSGKILQLADQFLPGGLFRQEEKILQIDPSDYALEIQKKKAAYKQALAALKLEEGRQAIARNELDMMERATGETLEKTDLALRKPQLEQAKADLEAAKADLNRAKLDLSRTSLYAPFNALILSREADLGHIVSTQDVLATLVGTDEYWIMLEVPIGSMRFLNFPSLQSDKGSLAKIDLDAGRGQRTGRILKMNGSLDEQSRLAKVIVTVSDPLLLKPEADKTRSPLVLGDFINVRLQGKKLKNTVRLPSSLLRGGQTVWVYKNGRLDIRTVRIIYQDRQYAYVVQGLQQGEHIITSDIATPLQGMELVTFKPDETREEQPFHE